MAQAPALTLRREDFTELQSADSLDRFFRPLNLFGQQVNAALSKGLTLADNSAAFVKTLTVTTGSPWIAPTLLNGWVNQGGSTSPAGYYRDAAGRVYLRGDIKSGTIGAAAFVLPAGYRPDFDTFRPVMTTGTYGYASVAASSGTVYAASGSNAGFDLDGISFLASPAAPGPSLLSAPLRFKNDLKAKPLEVRVAWAQDVTAQPSIPVALGPVAWATSSDQIVVSDIAGLAPSRKYQIAFIVVGG